MVFNVAWKSGVCTLLSSLSVSVPDTVADRVAAAAFPRNLGFKLPDASACLDLPEKPGSVFK